ncbi:MAG: universal stress protein [Syntrophorhabdaceae bacterium]|nr:universal stress protein [Syntrophorhabdaceae bacterium]
MLKPTKILVPTDFSRFSVIAYRQAIDIAEQYGAEVHVLHVVEEKVRISIYEYDMADKEISPGSIKRFEGRMRKEAEGRMIKFMNRHPPGDKVKVVSHVVKGTPVTDILQFQKDKSIDLIVISSLGHGALAEYFIGSVARNVLKGATCPVLLTKS